MKLIRLRTILKWAERNEELKRIIDFYDEYFLGNWLSISDLVNENEDLESNEYGKRFYYDFFKIELYRRGTSDFLKGYPRRYNDI
jgi:hypothetical protein